MRQSTSRRSAALLAVLGVAMGTVGCGGGNPIPASVSVGTACAAGDGDRVELQGFLRLPERISLTDRAVIDLFARRGGAGDRASVELVLGTGPNQLERPEPGFTPTSLRVRGADGTVATLNDRVALVADIARDGVECVLRDPTITVLPS